MTLRRRLFLTSLVVCVPAGAAAWLAIEGLRTHEQREALRLFVTGTVTEGLRTQCEADPNWFLAGQRERPRPEEKTRAGSDADVMLPRPSTDPLPFEFFPYDEQFAGSSSAAPRMPDELKRALRFVGPTAIVPFATPDGTGQQMAVATGWRGSPCAILLFRLRSSAHQRWQQAATFGGIVLSMLAISWLVAWETERRIRHVAGAARESAHTGFTGTAPVTGRDEIGVAASAFNEAGAEIRRLGTEVKDRDEAMRRLIAAVQDEVERPEAGTDVRRTFAADARLHNLLAAATLRLTRDLPRGESIDLAELTHALVARYDALARAARVTLALEAPAETMTVTADPALTEQVIRNLIDNALRFTPSGGRVTVRLDAAEGRFTLRVTDNGPGASDETLTKLTAVRRFRGDESRQQQPGGIGLGLAVVREVCDRLGWTWSFGRAQSGGFEAEVTGPAH